MTSPKGRPTPKRGAVARGPVAPPPQTRKEAAQRQREQQSSSRKGRRAGYVAHDETKLLPRDQGPVRALVRDVVDSRRNVGVLLLPLALLLVVAQVAGNHTLYSVAARIWTVGLVAVVLDAVLLALRVRKALAEHHPEAGGTAKHVGYALLRSTVMRRLRMPPPLVSPGSRS
ncbi:MAG: Integral rane protein [Frankiales bacterium]|nr:Integral rane protein [Frankiales bacterium]